MIEGRIIHPRTLEPYKNDEEFLCELEDALLEYLPGEIYVDRLILINAMQNIDNLFIKLI